LPPPASGHKDLVLDLIKSGANVNEAQAGVLSSPLAHALKADHMPVAHALLAAGAHLPSSSSSSSAPVLHMLAASCSPQALKYILSTPSNPSASHVDAALLVAAGVKGCQHSATIISSLLAVGANASAVGDNGHSALMRAAVSNDDAAFRVLLQAGADLRCTRLG
jgi:ankyrin repeat protein